MLARCPNCEKPIVVPDPGVNVCPRCAARILIQPPTSPDPDTVISARPSSGSDPLPSVDPPAAGYPQEIESAEAILRTIPVPWEERRRLGVLTALFQTVRFVLFAPSLFFSVIRRHAWKSDTIFYGWIFITLGYVFAGVNRWLMKAYFSDLSFVSGNAPLTPQSALIQTQIEGAMVLVLVLAPLLSLGLLYLNTWLYHTVLTLLGPTAQNRQGTFKVVAYGASPLWLHLIPFIGDSVAFVWMLSINVIGLSRVHGISQFRAMLAVLIPPILFSAILMAMIFLAGESLTNGAMIF